ncbi:MAG TPA: DPP IV N-terminal domain-containing protein [Polyangiaceae bacterium]
MSSGAHRRVLATLLGVALWGLANSARAGDPYIAWFTVKSPHFRVHYHGGLEQVAQRTANFGESVYARLVPELGWTPTEVTEIVLSDDTESANGSASALPYNIVRLFATAPDDMSVLGDYDDWVGELVTHEYTHIVHLDNVSGVPALVNAILGKTWMPNQEQPRWILEGLAVVMESEHTSAGRLRSTQFDMYLRADVLEHRLAGLDQISNNARRWPGGNLWYLYGAKFIEWIIDTYGSSTFAAVASDYGRAIVPFGINRSIRRATGRTYEQLYAGFSAYLEQRYATQVAAVTGRGLREGRRLTRRGFVAQTPRFMPSCGGDRERRVAYLRGDGDSTAGVYAIDPDAADPDDSAELLARSNGTGLTFDAECALLFDNPAPSRRAYPFNDIFRLPRGERAPRGIERNRQRLTIGERSREPDVSADGRSIVYVTNRAGTSTLRIAELDQHHEIHGERRLVASAAAEQAYTPRFSPDGRSVAYSAWTSGGFRDIRIVDVATGSFRELMHDRALDQQPTWSPDGHTLYFVSDRTGIANVYAYDVASGLSRQVTNVLTGAYMPAISADGNTLVYVGYGSGGFDLYQMKIDPTRFIDPLPALEERAPPASPTVNRRWPVEPYNALPTLRPHAYSLAYGLGTFGNTLTVTTVGADAVGLHAFDATVSVPTTGSGEIQGSLDYLYARLPFLFRASVFRAAAPRRDYQYGNQFPLTTEHLTGVTTGLSFDIPGEFDDQRVSLSYTIADSSRSLPVGALADPYATATQTPQRGYLGVVRLGYGYSNAEGSTYGISLEKGLTLGIGLDVADPAFGSESTLTAVSGALTAYQLMPWARHHVLALGLTGASAIGTYAERGLYSTGGFVDQPIFDSYRSGLLQSSFVLRGYAPQQFIGQSYNLTNVEYRFPIWYADHGISTLPLFLRTLSGTLFFDYGGAYDAIDPKKPFALMHAGVGGELWIDALLGYAIASNLRLGIARGLDAAAPGWMRYAVLASTF